MSLLACFLSSAIALASAFEGPGEDEPGVLRVYDLAAARPLVNSSTGAVAVLPSLRIHGSPDHPFGTLGEYDDEVDFLVEFVRDSFEAEFDSEGRELHALESGELVVRGPEHLHRGIEALLGSLSTALWSETELVVDLVRDVELPAHWGGASLVDEADIGPLVDEAAEYGALERYRLSVGPGREAVIDVGRREVLLIDYDVEVSEGAHIRDPQVWDVQLGNRLGLRVAPGPGGLYLALALRRALPFGDVREEVFKLLSYVNLGEGHAESRAEELTFQCQDVAHRSLALSSFLPDGQALVVASELDGDGAELLVVRRAGPSLSAFLTAAGEQGAPEIRVIDQGAVHPPACASSLRDDFKSLPDVLPVGPDWYWRHDYFLGPVDRDDVPLLDLIGEDLGQDEEGITLMDRWPWVLVSGAPAGGSRAEDTVRALMPDAGVVQVQLTLRGGGAGGDVLARIGLPARTGVSSAAVLGIERQLMRDSDVEIAKYAAVEDPIVMPSFSGLIVDLEPRVDVRGGVSLDLMAFAARSVDGPREVEVAPGSRRELQQEATDQLLAKQVLRFPAAGAAEGRVLLGDAAGSLVLEVSVRR